MVFTNFLSQHFKLRFVTNFKKSQKNKISINNFQCLQAFLRLELTADRRSEMPFAKDLRLRELQVRNNEATYYFPMLVSFGFVTLILCGN